MGSAPDWRPKSKGGASWQPGRASAGAARQASFVVAVLTDRAYIGVMAMTDEKALKRRIYPGERYTVGLQATYMGDDALHAQFGADIAPEAPPAAVLEQILGFGGLWFFCLFLLQAVAEFTNALPMSLANVAYSLAIAIGLTACLARWHRTTSRI
jgi:hypothetical protein